VRTDQIRSFVDRFEADFQNRSRFQLYRNDNRPITLAEAYEIQGEILTRALRSGTDSVAGYKVGLTTGKMQKFCGVDQPIAGRILKSGVHSSGARLRKSHFHRLGIESELALRVGKEIPAGANADQVLACIDAIAAAFEVIDDRDADYTHLEASSIAAENSWNRGIVLGESASPAACGDLRELEGQLIVNGEPAGTGSSSDVVTGPLGILAWVAGFARDAGEPICPGQWIMTGSIIPTKFAVAGDTYSFQLSSLSPVTVTIH
jgi:2-keto-4-pentenoate hydratase